jgi:uncharacterized protein YcbK (DUF882 family)
VTCKGPIGAISRRGAISGAFALGVAAVGQSLIASPAIARGKGDIRVLNLINKRTGDQANTVYWVDGQYIDEALAEINFLLRDWRAGEVIDYDRRAVDIIAASQKLLDSTEPFEVVSGYRSPATNAWLRKRRRGVAKNSYHTLGMAADVTMKSRSVRQIYGAAVSCRGGGVGRYSRSRFVHMDCGPLRTWGR